MKRAVFSYFEIAAKTARQKEDRRTYLLGAIGIRSDGAMVKSLNGPTVYPVLQAHAEARLIRKLDAGSVVYVARVAVGTGELVMARPCKNCERLLRNRGVKAVYYTKYNNEFGMIDFYGEDEKHFSFEPAEVTSVFG